MNNRAVFTATLSINGMGVFASTYFQKGALILAIDDTRVVDEDHPLNIDEGDSETYCDWLGDTVVLMQAPEKYINHACDPNTFVKTINGIRYVMALKNIEPNQEITYDYCINGYGDIVWNCNCNTARCRKTIHSDFFHLPLSIQIEYLPLLDSWYCERYKNQIQKLIQQQLIR